MNTLTFQFASFISLERLKNGPGGDIQNTFSGTVASVPDGGDHSHVARCGPWCDWYRTARLEALID